MDLRHFVNKPLTQGLIIIYRRSNPHGLMDLLDPIHDPSQSHLSAARLRVYIRTGTQILLLYT